MNEMNEYEVELVIKVEGIPVRGLDQQGAFVNAIDLISEALNIGAFRCSTMRVINEPEARGAVIPAEPKGCKSSPRADG